MVTCYLSYTIDPNKINDFEFYAKSWIPIVNEFGGIHHGYFLPHEGENNKAVALFSFNSLAEYEKYRTDSSENNKAKELYDFARKTKCIMSYKRSFMKPLIK